MFELLSKFFLTSLLISYRSSDGQILIASSSDGYCSIIHFEEGELGKIYKIKDSVQKNTVVNGTSKSSGKKSSNGIIKNKNNIPIFDADDCAMDIELIKNDTIDTTTNNRSEESNGQKSDKVMDSQNVRSENDLQIDKKLNEEETEDIKLVYDEENSSDASKTKTKNTSPKSDVAPIIQKTPRRVQLITLSSPKRLKK